MTKNREEPIGVIIHIYMEISQGKSLCIYLYFKQQKNTISFFLFFFPFSSTKSENRRADRTWGNGGRLVPVEVEK
jgi:hypothetical protein